MPGAVASGASIKPASPVRRSTASCPIPATCRAPRHARRAGSMPVVHSAARPSICWPGSGRRQDQAWRARRSTPATCSALRHCVPPRQDQCRWCDQPPGVAGRSLCRVFSRRAGPRPDRARGGDTGRPAGIALGYQDLIDHDELRHDPLMAVLAGRLEARREDCAPVAGKSVCTMRRIEAVVRPTCGTIRLKLLKIGALVTESVRRIKVAMASGCPVAEIRGRAAIRLAAAAARARASPA
jgi:hypothetical protein